MANPISKLNLVINGVTTQLDVHDANALTTEIDSMGTGWVRYKCGLQVCYGSVTNNNNIATGIARHSFPVAFIATPSVVAAPYIAARFNIYAITLEVESATAFIINTWSSYATPPVLSDAPLACCYVAIGKWK